MSVAAIDSFGGLNLIDPVQGGGAAIATDVDLSVPGRLKNRLGRVNVQTTAATSFIQKIVRVDDAGFAVLSAGWAAAYVPLNGGAASGVQTTTPLPVDAVMAYSPTTGEAALFTVFQSNGVQRFDVTGFHPVAGSPNAMYLTVHPQSGRLVAANAATATPGGNSSRVYFSNPGDGETWGADDWVDLSPGDGEEITGMATWNNTVVVFKHTRAFVFYSESVDSAGGPLFNFTSVALGDYVQLSGGPGFMTANQDGIFFCANRGIYRYSGGTPELISTAISPLFDNSAIAPYEAFSPWALCATSERLFVSSIVNSQTLVLDFLTGAWSMYSIAASAFMVPGDDWATVDDFGGRGVYIADYATKKVTRLTDTVTTDLGTEITGTYASNLSDFGEPAEKFVRELQVTGTWNGTVSTSMCADADTADATYDTPVSLTSGTLAPKRDRRARRGYQLGWRLEGTGEWSVSRLGVNFRNAGSG